MDAHKDSTVGNASNKVLPHTKLKGKVDSAKRMRERQVLDKIAESLFLKIDNLGSMSYLITLEAFRRGIKVNFKYSYNEDNGRFSNSTKLSGLTGIYFTLTKDGKKYDFIRGLSSLTKVEDSRISDNKILAKNKMKSHGVIVPEGFIYNKEKSKVYKNKNGVFIVKPNRGSLGYGFVDNLTLKEAIDIANERQSEQVIERKVYGEEYRVYVVNNKAVSALKRLRPTLVGDGVKTVLELYNEKLNTKKNNIAYKKKPLPTKKEVENHLKEQGIISENIWSYIWPKDKILEIGQSNSVSQGGDLIECLETLPKKVEEEAIKASNVLNMPFAGVDIIYNTKQKQPFILEVNCNPHFRFLSTKLKGYINEAYNDIAVAIIDLHFPDSKRIKGLENINFNFHYITKILESGIVSDIGLPEIDESWEYKEVILRKSEREKNEKIHNMVKKLGAYPSFYENQGPSMVMTILAPKKNMKNILQHFKNK